MTPRSAFRWRAVLTSLLSLSSFPRTTAAATPRLQVIAETNLGYTDNVQAAPSTPSAGTTRVASAFVLLSPGLELTLESPKSLVHFGYRYEYALYFGAADSSSSSNRLDYQGFFALSRRVTFLLGANVTESNRYTAVAFAPPGAGVVSALPTGAGAFLQAGVSELFSFDVAEAWRAWQAGSALVQAPVLGTLAPQTTTFGTGGGLERSFLVDAVGIEARADYTLVAHAVQSDGAPAGLQRLLVAGAGALWRHDWGRYFTSHAGSGAVRVQRFDAGRGFWSPTANAALAYANIGGDAELSFAHGVTTNALLGQSLLVDDVRLRGALPLTPGAELVLAVTSGYQHGRLIDANASLAERVDVVLGDVLLLWQVTPLLSLGLRYQHAQQWSDALLPPLPISFVQNNVLFALALKFPPSKDMPAPYRRPRRVDRSDEIRATP